MWIPVLQVYTPPANLTSCTVLFAKKSVTHRCLTIYYLRNFLKIGLALKVLNLSFYIREQKILVKMSVSIPICKKRPEGLGSPAKIFVAGCNPLDKLRPSSEIFSSRLPKKNECLKTAPNVSLKLLFKMSAVVQTQDL